MNNNYNVNNTITELQQSCTRKSVSEYAEIETMKSMLNDENYIVNIYNSRKPEQVGEYNPSTNIRSHLAIIFSKAASISYNEALNIINSYEFTNNDASAFVNLSKEFINTYLMVGRPLNMGGRDRSNITLIQKQVPMNRNEEQSPLFISAKVMNPLTPPRWL